MEVLYKSHYSNDHLQMGQNPITIAKDSGQNLITTFSSNLDKQAGGVWGADELCKLPKGATEAAAAAIKFRLESIAFIATKAGDMHPENTSSNPVEFQFWQQN